MHRRRELKNDRNIRMVLLGMSVNFSICSISSNVTVCRIGIPASNAEDVMSSVLRRMIAVNCDFSSSFLLSLVLDGVDME